MRTDTLPPLPEPRGPLTDQLFGAWLAGSAPWSSPNVAPGSLDDEEVLVDDDVQLALYAIHELSYRGFAGVDPDTEVDLTTAAWRRALEDRMEAALRRVTAGERRHPVELLRDLADQDGGPSLSAELLAAGRADRFAEFLVHRAPYQLKEADPHTWAIPRMWGLPKAAIVEIQMDEYGEGRPGAAHAELFADTLRAADLPAEYGVHVDLVPGATLATTNLISLLGGRRRLVPALVGHLALFEMTSVGPMGRYAALCDRLGLPPAARRFYDVHVEADAHHGPLALERMVRGLLDQDPTCGPEITFGAAALSHVEGTFTQTLRDAWAAGRSSLRRPATPAAARAA